MRWGRLLAVPPLLAVLVVGLNAQAPKGKAPLKVYIGADMEGLVGTVTGSETGPRAPDDPRNPWREDYPRYREILTQLVAAVADEAYKAGATEVLVNESHGALNFRNLLIENLPKEVRVARGWPRPHVMSTGLDGSFAGMIYLGYHARAGSAGVMAHTYAFDDLLINGVRMGEAEFNAFYGGEMGVPLLVASGDNVLEGQVKEQMPWVEFVVVKEALGRSGAITITPAKAEELLRAATRKAIANRAAAKPYTLTPPYRAEITLREAYGRFMSDVMNLKGYDLMPTGPRSFTYTTDRVANISQLFNDVEEIVIGAISREMMERAR